MAYSAEISRVNPALFVFLLDQSGSMSENFGGYPQARKADVLAKIVNQTLYEMVLRCVKGDKVRDYYEVAILGYGYTDETPVTPLLPGAEIKKISEIASSPLRLEELPRRVPDAAGGTIEQTIKIPIWIEPCAGRRTPMCAAFRHVKEVVESWLANHYQSFPPVVLHVTDGESTDGDPARIAQSLMELESEDGNVLLFNCHLSSRTALPHLYPATSESLPDDYARSLFSISSVIPEPFRHTARQMGIDLDPGARGFVFNASPDSLVQFFNIGTRPAELVYEIR